MSEYIPASSNFEWANSTISNTNRPHPEAEQLMKSDYTEDLRAPSHFAPGATKKVYCMRCPACGHLGRETEHWEVCTCPACGLHMYTAGNSLEVWRNHKTVNGECAVIEHQKLLADE